MGEWLFIQNTGKKIKLEETLKINKDTESESKIAKAQKSLYYKISGTFEDFVKTL